MLDDGRHFAALGQSWNNLHPPHLDPVAAATNDALTSSSFSDTGISDMQAHSRSQHAKVTFLSARGISLSTNASIVKKYYAMLLETALSFWSPFVYGIGDRWNQRVHPTTRLLTVGAALVSTARYVALVAVPSEDPTAPGAEARR